MDLIDRNAILNRYQEICNGTACMDCPFYKDGCAVEKFILDVEPISRGKWIHTGFMEVKCSNCGNVFHELEDTNYCPSCGAKMIPTIPKEIIDAVLGEDEVDDEDN